MPDEPARPPLGRRPPDPENLRRAVDATPFLLAGPRRRVVSRPIALDPPTIDWPGYWNTQAGVCVVASKGHALATIADRLGASYTPMTEAQVLAEYRTQNPGFDGFGDWADDNGMVMQTYNEWLVATGQILAFGRVDTSEDVLKSAAYVGESLTVGASLYDAQAEQFDAGQAWDTEPFSPYWGGHAMALNGYDPDGVSLVTWGQQITATDRFVANQVDEAWFLLTRWHVENRPPWLDLVGFAAAVEAVTDGKVVVPLDPVPPVPTPEPRPAPGGCLVDAPRALVRGVRNGYRKARGRG